MDIKTFIKKYECTIADMAILVNISNANMCNIKNGKMTPSLRTAYKIYKVSGGQVNIEDMLPEKEKEKCDHEMDIGAQILMRKDNFKKKIIDEQDNLPLLVKEIWRYAIRHNTSSVDDIVRYTKHSKKEVLKALDLLKEKGLIDLTVKDEVHYPEIESSTQQ